MGQNTDTWTATLTGNVIVEAWASGAAGLGSGGGSPAFGGGGGGEYARTAGIAVVSGNPYGVAWGVGGIAGLGGDDTQFNTASPLAKRGLASTFGAGGLGGTGGTGDVTFDGANGGANGSGGGGGAGGGGSGSDAGPGNPGSIPSGGAAVPRGGAGGDADNGNGTGPGGGGAGSGGFTGGDGEDGAIIIWEDLGVWPPCGQTPLATYGSIPASFWDACSRWRVYSQIIG